MASSKLKTLSKAYEKQAKASEWDDLAFSIMVLESSIYQEKDVKSLKLLRLKLEIFEEEKSSRVFDTFNMEYFLNKELEDLSELYI
jgi:hypothetical protein